MILKLDRDINPSPTVTFTRLPERTDSFPARTDCILNGWGKTVGTQESPGSDVLMKGPLTAIPRLRGDHFGRDMSKLFARPGGPNQSSGCKGDSGGPLYCPAQNGGGYYQMGIMSGGNGICGYRHSLAHFGNIASMLPWIRQHS